MKPYIFSILFLLSVNFSFSQTKELFLKESYEIDENTILEIDIDNATIVFEESKDNKVYFDYSIFFSENSDKTQYKVFQGVKAKSTKTNNIIKLNVKNSMYLGELYSLDVDFDMYKEHILSFYKNQKKNKLFYKSKDSVIKEIDFSLGLDSSDYFKKLKLDNPNTNYGKSARKFKQDFIIKVPKNVKIKIKALHSKINFNFNTLASIEINSFKTFFKFKEIQATQNRIIASNGIFQAEKITNARIELLDMSKVVIGEVTNSEFATETSKIEIGEVGKNVDFNDFNSKIYFYNFSNNFSKFNLKGDYSKLYFYNIKDANYSMDVFGQNTALNMNKTKTTFGLSKDKKLDKILEKKVKVGAVSEGNIEIELRNGILNIK